MRSSTSYVCTSVKTDTRFPIFGFAERPERRAGSPNDPQKIVAFRRGGVAGTQRQLCACLTNGMG